MTQSRFLPVALLSAGCIIAAAVYLSAPHSPRSAARVRPISTADHILGNPAARATIIEYADFDCEYCKSLHETLHQLIATEGATGNIAWVLREFPLTELHPNAHLHARAAECAAQVGGNTMFWKFTDALYASQPIDPKNYGALASEVGLTGDDFATCYANASPLDRRIAADRQNALEMGATGAPYAVLIVTGKSLVVIDGAYAYDDLKTIVDQALR